MTTSDRRVRDVGEVLEDLERLRARRAALPDDAYHELLDLKEGEREIRIELAAARAAARSPATPDRLRAELAAIESRIEGITATHIDVVRQAGGGSAGGDFGFAIDAHRLNRQIDEAAGRAELEAQAQELRNRLREIEQS